MKKISLFLVVTLSLACCTRKEPYNPATHLNEAQQQIILGRIITYIFTAPPYTRLEDRFLEKHEAYYLSLTPKFEMVSYFISKDSTHYFYVIRPSSIASEKRAVGGHFKLKDDRISDFKEEFVTTVMPTDELKTKASFLFDEMVKGNLKNFVTMKHYIQWPNEASYYDSISYEWKIKPDVVN